MNRGGADGLAIRSSASGYFEVNPPNLSAQEKCDCGEGVSLEHQPNLRCARLRLSSRNERRLPILRLSAVARRTLGSGPVRVGLSVIDVRQAGSEAVRCHSGN